MVLAGWLMLEIEKTVSESIPNSVFSIKPKVRKINRYEPDKNGYFVCKANMLVANTSLCKQYQGNKFNRFDYRQPYNLNCASCTINLEEILGKTLDEFHILSAELEQLVRVKFTPPKFEYHASELGIEYLSSEEKQIEKINNFINYGDDFTFN